MSGQNVPSHFAPQYANTVELLLQQKMAKIRPFVSMGMHKGEGASPVDQIGAVEMQEVVSRFSPMGRVDSSADRRWVYPSEYELPQLLDSFDDHKLLIDPRSKYVENAHAAANRKFDAIMAAAAFADAKTGKTGSTNTSFLSGNQVAVNYGSSGNSGLTVAKLLKAQELFLSHEVDLEKEVPTILITSGENTDLLNEYKIISKDFNSHPVLVDGRIKYFMGFNFVHYENLPTDGSGYRRIPVFVKSGLYLGIWQDTKTSISQRNDLSGEPWQAYIKMQAGGTRLEEKKVIEIKCA